jgi:hypothetical protein
MTNTNTVTPQKPVPEVKQDIPSASPEKADQKPADAPAKT